MSFDVSRSDNPRVSSVLDLMLVQIFKADCFNFYAINYKPYGLPINRPHPLNGPLFKLFPFESMRSEGLCLNLSIFPSRRCVLMNNKNSKLPYFPLIFSEDYHCQVILRSKNVPLNAFTAAP